MPVPQGGRARPRVDAQNDMLLRIVNKQDKVPIGVDGGQYVAGGEEIVPNEISTLVLRIARPKGLAAQKRSWLTAAAVDAAHDGFQRRPMPRLTAFAGQKGARH